MFPLFAEDSPGSPSGSTAKAPTGKQEIKLFVTAANTAQAIKGLKLDQHQAVRQIACFFETSDGTLQKNDLILRARQKTDALGESTVKIRAARSADGMTAAEHAIELEQDWTADNQVSFSRSVNHSTLGDGLVAKVAAGKLPVNLLFNESQRDLVSARIKNFQWNRLRCFGPVEVEVWRKQWKIRGFSEKVTVELWHLQRNGKKLDILEVSAKTTAESDAHAKVLAKQFYDAASAYGLGEPANLTKTQLVMDFFKPGTLESQTDDNK